MGQASWRENDLVVGQPILAAAAFQAASGFLKLVQPAKSRLQARLPAPKPIISCLPPLASRAPPKSPHPSAAETRSSPPNPDSHSAPAVCPYVIRRIAAQSPSRVPVPRLRDSGPSPRDKTGRRFWVKHLRELPARNRERKPAPCRRIFEARYPRR